MRGAISFRSHPCSLLILILTATPALADLSTQPATTQAADSPIHYRQEVRTNPPLRLHIATVDLTDPAVGIVVRAGGPDPDGKGPWQATLAPVRQIAEREGLDLAVNGNFFSGKDTLNIGGKKMPYALGNWARADGWAMSDGHLWSAQPGVASVVVDTRRHVQIGRFDRLPADAREVVSGMQLLVSRGRSLVTNTEAAPRTAAGIDESGKTLVMLVVDGRRPDYSVGMTLPQLAEEMIHLGCSDALNLDGGGSSTMVVRDAKDGSVHVVNRPSDGHDFIVPMSLERSVIDVLGVKLRK